MFPGEAQPQTPQTTQRDTSVRDVLVGARQAPAGSSTAGAKAAASRLRLPGKPAAGAESVPTAQGCRR
jgi:hypothetical protein